MAIQATPTDQRNQPAGLSIVSALVNGVQVPVACPAAWCTENHTGDERRHVEDIDHVSDNVDLNAPAFNSSDDGIFDQRLIAYAHLGQDLYASDPNMRAAHVRVEDRGGEASYLTPDQADAFAGNLDAFATQIRTLAHTARGTQAVEPGHYPWCTPGACAIYQGDEGPTVEHRSADATITAPAGFQASKDRILHAHLVADDAYEFGAPAVSAVDATGSGTLLDTEALDQLIDQTANALTQLRAMRLHMQAAQA
ncbi:hypothetical protein MBT84_19785 [Streptomyces sp. MBT84]|uniref:DUF6907 domain-containing protein n=1 Tax=Streptomyces sp. MBT84 TaxID=1488414 RepID=UPI001C6E07F9|nr:hypothetical protein [Streptomyces sp. MBT84]MBW8701851.1 hypothetical protein [Streptomyces sp. MBT84]